MLRTTINKHKTAPSHLQPPKTEYASSASSPSRRALWVVIWLVGSILPLSPPLLIDYHPWKDLYIKEKNPKPADGIHDVDEIRRMRGKITRRHARGLSSAVASGSGPKVQASSPTASASPSRLEPPAVQRVVQATAQPVTNGFYSEARPSHPNVNMNKLDWRATGVINDIPPHNNHIDARTHPRPTPMLFEAQSKERLQQPQEHRDASSGNRTAELALKDVLRSIKVANNRLKRPQPFDFDFFTLTFPAICLRIQPPPPSLFSTIPSSGGKSWPLEPPNRMEFESVNRILRNRIKAYNSMFPVDELRRSRTKAELEQGLSSAVDTQTEQYCQHLNSAFDQWQSLNTQEQERIWNLEIMRAYVSTSQDHQATKRKLEEVEDTVEALKARLQTISQAQASPQSGSEATHVPPVPIAIARELGKTEDSIIDWDYDTLMEKYQSANSASWDNRLTSAIWYGTPTDPFFNSASGLAQMSTSNPQPFQGAMSQNVNMKRAAGDAIAPAGQPQSRGDVEMNDS